MDGLDEAQGPPWDFHDGNVTGTVGHERTLPESPEFTPTQIWQSIRIGTHH